MMSGMLETVADLILFLRYAYRGTWLLIQLQSIMLDLIGATALRRNLGFCREVGLFYGLRTYVICVGVKGLRLVVS